MKSWRLCCAVGADCTACRSTKTGKVTKAMVKQHERHDALRRLSAVEQRLRQQSDNDLGTLAEVRRPFLR